MSLKIAFFGLPLAALLLRRDGYELVYAGICRKDAIGNRRLARVASFPVELVPSLGKETTIATIERGAPDLIVSWFWTKKIPARVLSIPKLGAIGVHPSLLPRHRGPDPYYWAIARGDRETGVTAHRLDEEYDTGEIIDRKTLAIDPTWNAWTLAKKLDRPSLALLRRVVSDIARGRRIESRPQPRTGATDAPAPTDDELLLSFEERADEIVRRVRAASPWPGAFFDFGGRLLIVTRAHVTARDTSMLAPGEATILGDEFVVRAKDAGVVVDEARDENDEAMGKEALLSLFGSIVELEKKRL